MGLTREQMLERYEDWKYRKKKVEEGEVEPGIRPGMDYDNFVQFLSGIKKMKDLVDKIEEYDPYDYKIIYVYDHKVSYRGIKIKIKFYKGGQTVVVPKDRLDVIYFERQLLGKIRALFTIIKRRKNDDSNGGFGEIDQ